MSRSSEGKGAALIPARFAARPNRFIVEAALNDGRQVQAHLADPGRLLELLLPGAELRLRPVAPESERRTRYTVALVRSSEPPRVWVSVDTTLPNRLARRLLEEGRVRGAPRGATVRPEVRHGASRFDFELRGDGGDSMLVEVKSVTLVENGVALFPDAPTVRGARHVRELAAHAGNGGRAMVLFVVQRDDARLVRPNPVTDPDFALALSEARGAGVLLRAARFRLTPSGRATWLGPLPVRAGNRG